MSNMREVSPLFIRGYIWAVTWLNIAKLWHGIVLGQQNDVSLVKFIDSQTSSRGDTLNNEEQN